MPLKVFCKGCGRILFKAKNIDEFGKFDPYRLPKVCPNCGRSITFNPASIEVNIFPIKTVRRRVVIDNDKKARNKRYTLTFAVLEKLKFLGHERCVICKQAFKNGDRVLSIKHRRAKIFHEDCYFKRYRNLIVVRQLYLNYSKRNGEKNV